MREWTLEEIIEERGISARNIKYWTSIYTLDTRREGRRNFYPEITVEILSAVHALAELQLFSTRYIRMLVDHALQRDCSDPDRARDYARHHEALSKTLPIPAPLFPGLPHAEAKTSSVVAHRVDDVRNVKVVEDEDDALSRPRSFVQSRKRDDDSLL